MELQNQDEQGPMRQQEIEEFRAKLITRDLRDLTEQRILIASVCCFTAMLYFLGFLNGLEVAIFLAVLAILGWRVWPPKRRRTRKENAELMFNKMSLREIEQFLRKENSFVRVLVIWAVFTLVCYFTFSTPLARTIPPLLSLTTMGLFNLRDKYRDNRLADEAAQLAGQAE